MYVCSWKAWQKRQTATASDLEIRKTAIISSIRVILTHLHIHILKFKNHKLEF